MSREVYLTNLTALAQVSGFTLTPAILALYEKHLAPLGYDAVAAALESMVVNRRARDAFPSVRDIRLAVRPELDADQEAALIVGRVVQALSRIGPYRPEAAREFIGEIGWSIVTSEGGWVTLCEMVDYDNLPTLKAQWRRYAEARLQSGAGASYPSLPPPDPTPTRRLEAASGEQRVVSISDILKTIGKGEPPKGAA